VAWAGTAARPESPGFRRGLLFDRLATTGGRVIPPWNKSPERKRWDTGYEYHPGHHAFKATHNPAARKEANRSRLVRPSIVALCLSFR